MNATYFIFFNVASRKCKTMHMTCIIYVLNSPVLGGNREKLSRPITLHIRVVWGAYEKGADFEEPRKT